MLGITHNQNLGVETRSMANIVEENAVKKGYFKTMRRFNSYKKLRTRTLRLNGFKSRTSNTNYRADSSQQS